MTCSGHATFYCFYHLQANNVLFSVTSMALIFTPFRFCVEFKLESRTPHCAVENRPHTLWMRYITEGFKVCVACEPPAKRNTSGSCQGDGQESDKYEIYCTMSCSYIYSPYLSNFLLYNLDFNVELIRDNFYSSYTSDIFRLVHLAQGSGTCGSGAICGSLVPHRRFVEALTKT